MNFVGFFGAVVLSVMTLTAPVDTAADYTTMENVVVEEYETKIGYATTSVNVRDLPDISGNKIRVLRKNAPVNIIGFVSSNPYNSNTYYITDDGGFVHSRYITFTAPSSGSTEKAAATPDANPGVQLPVSNILQNPELPNGCEITSLSIVLNYKGYAVDKCDMSDNYLPKWPDLTGDPEYYYLREPRSNGFYCFATCLCTTIDNYNAANGTSIQYKNLTGLSASDLYAEIDAGNPVVVWGTLKWSSPRAYANGLYRNLHCMVLAGYSDTTVTIIDPIYGDKLKTIKRSTFENVWTQMGSRAMTVTQ